MEKKQCNDDKCAAHGALKVHGRTFVGVVVAAKMHRSATIEWERRRYVQKYERYEKTRTRVNAHNPDCISAKKGEIVLIKECRPISKTKHFVILERIGEERLFAEREALLEEAKVKKQKAAEPEAAK